MDRATKRDEHGNANIIALSDAMPDIFNALTDAIKRLAVYEETGLTPGEIWQAMLLLREYKKLGTIDEIKAALS